MLAEGPYLCHGKMGSLENTPACPSTCYYDFDTDTYEICARHKLDEPHDFAPIADIYRVMTRRAISSLISIAVPTAD